jgi:hypothetical protein
MRNEGFVVDFGMDEQENRPKKEFNIRPGFYARFRVGTAQLPDFSLVEIGQEYDRSVYDKPGKGQVWRVHGIEPVLKEGEPVPTKWGPEKMITLKMRHYRDGGIIELTHTMTLTDLVRKAIILRQPPVRTLIDQEKPFLEKELIRRFERRWVKRKEE